MATNTGTGTAALSMKLLIDRRAQRVLLAEANQDAVDFLFSLLAMPVATALKLVGKEAMVGCVGIGNLYASVDKLGSTNDVLTGAAKDALLCPAVTSPAAATTAGTSGSSLLRLSPAPPFVQGAVATYTVADDLTVALVISVSPISSISMLGTFAVKDIGDLQEKTVQLGYNESLAILKASLQSTKSVLTDVFLHGNNNKQQAVSSSTPLFGTSSGYQDGVAGGPVARETRDRKPSSRVFGQQWSNNS